MQPALDTVMDLLDLEVIEENLFRGVSPDEDRQRVFGGQVAGQALVAAARTVEDRLVHSLHAYFLRAGDPAVPILYEVERTRDGRSFTTRRVTAIQHGQTIFTMSASFHRVEQGFSHQDPMPDAPAPEQVPTFKEEWEPFRDQLGALYDRDLAIDVRYAKGSMTARDEPHEPHVQVWLRADGDLGDDPVLHTCLFTYASDLTLLNTATLPHSPGAFDGSVQMASLDHAMWFHRPFRMDDWLLYDQRSPSVSGARGLATGSVFTRAGELVVSVVQEGLIRPVDGR